MIITSGFTVSVLVSALILSLGRVEAARQGPLSSSPAMSLCDALETIEEGEALPITVSGVYAVNYEMQVFYDPKQPLCEQDIQPSTWVEFDKLADGRAGLAKLIEQDHRAYVTFEGTLFGPRPLAPDNPALPAAMSLPDRMRDRRYGHQNAFRTEFLVTRVLSAGRVPKAMPWNLVWFAPESSNRSLEVTHADIPSYPMPARLAGLEGEVEVEAMFESGIVTSARVIAGDRALGEAAMTNIKTWKSSPSTSGTFVIHFVYNLERKRTSEQKGSKVELELPYSVRVTAPRIDW